MAVRHRRHANPLAFQRELARPRYAEVFGRAAPLEVEIGFGKGQFLLAAAQARPESNLIGLEIREFLVGDVMAKTQGLGLKNLFALHCNANTALDVLFSPGEVSRFYVHFPDPWFKKRHHKRRVVTPETARAMKALLRAGGEVHAMTDYEPIGIDMRECLEAAGLTNVAGAGQLMPASTTGLTSEREDWHMSQGHPVYRLLFRKN